MHNILRCHRQRSKKGKYFSFSHSIKIFNARLANHFVLGVNDESESGYPYYNPHGLHRHQLGYDSEFYGVSQPPARAHPPTPRSQFDNSDVGTDHEVDHYRYTEGSPFIPPPPTRCGSPRQTPNTHEDD